MPAPTNLGFETIGAVAGMADGWHLRGKCTAVEILGFGPAVTVGPVTEPNAFGGGTAWTKTGLTVTTNVGPDPDGNTTADRLTATATTGIHAAERPSENLASGGRYGVACWFRRVTSLYAALAWGVGTANESVAIFDLTKGRVVSTTRSGSISKASASILAFGTGGWFLATLYVATSAAITGIKPAVALSNGSALSYLGAGESANVWGAAVFDMPREGFEAFERAWLNDDFLATLTIPASAYPSTFQTSFVDPEGFEAFESGWSNFPFYSTISASAAATFDTPPEAVENFETEWNNVPFYSTISGAVAATFGTTTPEAFESFAADWLTSPWEATIAVAVEAGFDGDSFHPVDNPEDFEEVIRDRVYTVDVMANNLVSASHGLVNGTTIYTVKPYGGELPSAFNPTIRYFVVNAATSTLQLSETVGGVPVTLGDPGIGEQKLRGDPARFWNELGYNTTL